MSELEINRRDHNITKHNNKPRMIFVMFTQMLPSKITESDIANYYCK